MWIEGNYRRNLLDMHIDDWNEEFLSKVDPEAYAEALKEAGVQAAMVKAMPHTGLCNFPTKINRMHKGLKGRDFFGEVLNACHKRDIKVIAYFSQVFDNYASDKHPEWRTISAEGKTHRDFRNMGWFRNGRYGIVCPNNPEYRQYVKEHLEELNAMYDFEGMFLDMTFWPDVCYCPSCRKRYYEETGRELPRKVDWQDPDYRDWQLRREKWMAEFAAFTTKCIKDVHPECTIEHQMSMVASSWIHACTEWIADQVTYTGGDYYGGFLQQSFINKYYRNISPNLPFVYHTSRCDPELAFHTTTKSRDELLLHVITALMHNGAFLLVDAINPDGTIVPAVYKDLMKSIYAETKPMEQHIGGHLISDVNIWFSSHSKFDPNEKGVSIEDKNFTPEYFMDAPVKMASILREHNIPFDVIGSKNLKDCKAKVLALCHISQILDEEMAEIEKYLEKGGTLYVSGPIGHPRLAALLGLQYQGVCLGEQTEESFTYIDPAEAGKACFEGFDTLAPLSVPMKQYLIAFEDSADSASGCNAAEGVYPKDVEVYGTLTLPYTVPNTPRFSAIHSNPPGIHTNCPSAIKKKVGNGTIFYVAAPLEIAKPYMSRRVVARIMDELVGEKSYMSDAPKMVETLAWEKDGFLYFGLLNEQEEAPIIPVHDIHLSVQGDYSKAISQRTGEELPMEKKGDSVTITVPKLDVFEIIQLH